MKKHFVIVYIVLFAFACSSPTPIKNEDEKVIELYSGLSEIAVEQSNFKCDALLKVKQITPFHLLTNDGEVFDLSFSGIYSDNNQNCIIEEQLRDKKVKSILPTHFLPEFRNTSVYDVFYYDNQMRYIDKNYRMHESENKSYHSKFADNGLFKYTTYLVDMTTITTTASTLYYLSYIAGNKILSTANGKNYEPFEIEVFDLKEGEKIQKLTPFGLLTDKSVYLFRAKANKEQCEKYVDIKCQYGFTYSESASKIINEYSSIILYFDGYYIVTKTGQLFRLNHE